MLAVQILRGLSFGLSFLILWRWGWFPHRQESCSGNALEFRELLRGSERVFFFVFFQIGVVPRLLTFAKGSLQKGPSSSASRDSLRAQRLKYFKILKLSSEIEKFQVSHPPNPLFFVGGILKVDIEIFNRD